MYSFVRRPVSALQSALSQSAPQRRMVLVAMASVLLLSGCMLSPLFQAPAAVMTGFAVLLGLAACSGGGGGGGGGDQAPAETPAPPAPYVPPTVPGCMSTLSMSSGPVTWPAFAQIHAVVSNTALGFTIYDASAARLGDSLAAGCNVGGDGNFDLVIGMPYDGSHFGQVITVFGSSTIRADLGTSAPFGGVNVCSLGASIHHTMHGQNSYDPVGKALAMGDVNGDGTADLVIGQQGGEAGYSAGSAWVVFGGAGFTSVSSLALGVSAGYIDNTGARSDGFVITNTESHSYSVSWACGTYTASALAWNGVGKSVAVAELGGDSLADIIVGAPYLRSGYTNSSYPAYAAMRPRAAVVFGTQDAVAGATYDISGHVSLGQGFFAGSGGSSPNYNTSLGASVAVAGDLNGDKILDVIVGAPFGRADYNVSNSTHFGAAHIIFGKSGNPASATPEDLTGAGFSIVGDATNTQVGRMVAPAGDVNGDGILDVMVTSVKPGLYAPAQVSVVFGKSSAEAWSSPVAISQLSTTGQGFTVSLPSALGVTSLAAADVNGDGVADLLIGATNARVYDGSTFLYSNAPTGVVFVVFGKSGIADVDLSTPLDGSNGFQIVGKGSSLGGTQIGRAIAVGDINGDGYADIIVSGRVNNGEQYFDAVYVIFGGDTAGQLPAVPGSSLHVVVPVS